MVQDGEDESLITRVGQSPSARQTWRTASLTVLLSLLAFCIALRAFGSGGHGSAARVLEASRENEGTDTVGLAISSVSATVEHIELADAFFMHNNTDGTVALKMTNFKYVSCSRHGTLSANAGTIGPDEKFMVIEISDNTIALKSSYGKYVRAARNGTLAAISSGIGPKESFSRIPFDLEGETWFNMRANSFRYLGEEKVKLRLLTSAFVPRADTSEHVHEIFAAIEMNVLNDLIDEVHILTESNCEDLIRVMRQFAARMPNTTRTLVKMDQKIVCAMMRSGKQPTYREFFLYANTTIHDGLLIFSNADVVFDDTLRRLQPEKIASEGVGFVLSVRPPPADGDYKAIFGNDCRNTLRCAVGRWGGGGDWGQGPGAGSSWDAYVIAPPLPGNMDLDHIAVKMNIYGAENLAAFQLDHNGGLKLYNPCEHIYAFHWHCIGGKMHSKDMADRVDRPEWYLKMKGLPQHEHKDAIDGLMPCWYCPGVKLPGGTVPRKDLCRDGEIMSVDQVPKLKTVFDVGKIAVNLCCSKGHSFGQLNLENLGHCRTATDTDCVIWDVASWPHIY